MIRRLCRLGLALLALAPGCEPANDDPGPVCELAEGPAGLAITHFHGDAERRGRFDPARTLGAGAVQDGLVRRWISEPFDPLVVDGVEIPPLIYATPLLVEGTPIETEGLHGTADVVFTATSHGFVYAVAAADAGCDVDAGAVLWRRRLVEATPIEHLDQGVPMGVLSTPVIDLPRGRMFVAAHDRRRGWQVFGLALASGEVLAGWPVTIDDAALAPVNRNGPARFQASTAMSQRGALQLSPGADRVYVAFGTYWGSGAGWLVAVDTESPRIATAWSAAPSSEERSSGGMWGSAGPAVDSTGRVWVTTGNSPGSTGDMPGVWGSSLLEFDADLRLQRAYTPFDYCRLDATNMDLGASQPHLLAPLAGTSTPNLVAFGGKQGLVYLVDRDAMPMAGASRGPCSDDASTDRSLHAPWIQPYLGTRGPTSVFGPYSREFGEIDHAKMRTKLAEWEHEGNRYLFAAGSSKASESSTQNVPPSIARLRVVAEGGPAYLQLDAVEQTVVMANPGPPIVTGPDGDAVVWVLDRNAPRTAGLLDPSTPGPILYAFSAQDLRPLWTSEPLGRAGKYATPIAFDDLVLVATDRLEAFGPPADPGG